MIEVVQYNQNLKSQWDSFVVEHQPNMFFFQRNFVEYHKDRFIDFSLLVYSDSKLVGILPASKHANELVCHGGLTYGFLVTSDFRYQLLKEMMGAIVEFLKANKFENLIYKKPPQPFCGRSNDNDIFELVRRGGQLLKRELSSIIDLNNFSYNKGRKSSVTKASRENFEMRSGVEHLQDFYILLTNVLDGRHSVRPVHTLDDLKLLYAKFPNNLQVQIVVKDGEPVAGTLLFIFGDVIHTQYLCNSSEGRKLGALDFLLDTVIKSCSPEIKFLSFGISTEERGKVVNEGLLFQKESFGARNYSVDVLSLKI